MVWTQKQIRKHTKAAGLLHKIKDTTFTYIQQNPTCTEREILELIQGLFQEFNLKSAVADPIVAFGASSSDFHYRAPKRGSRHLMPNSLIMLDIWAHSNEPRAPFADSTWMAFYGTRVPKAVQKAFDTVIHARDASISLLRSTLGSKQLPTGYEVEHAAMKILIDGGYTFRKEIQHTTGHSLGTTSPHGRYGAVAYRNKNKLKKNLGYTIEPGIYIDERFGVRSEIDFYIDSSFKLHVTTPIQKKLVLL